MRDEERREALLGERVRRVERLGRRATPGTRRVPSPARAAASASASPCGDSQSSAANRSASNSRFGESEQVDERGGERPEHEEERALEAAADARQLDHGAGDHHRERLDEHVPVAEVRELVRDDALELGRRRDAEQARRDGERRAALRAASGGRARADSRPASR